MSRAIRKAWSVAPSIITSGVTIRELNAINTVELWHNGRMIGTLNQPNAAMNKFSTEDNEGNKDFDFSFSSLPSVKKVVGYVRGSTDGQVNTLEAQANQIRAYYSRSRFGLRDRTFSAI